MFSHSVAEDDDLAGSEMGSCWVATYCQIMTWSSVGRIENCGNVVVAMVDSIAIVVVSNLKMRLWRHPVFMGDMWLPKTDNKRCWRAS